MNAIRLGDPNLFVKGVAEQRVYDPATGNIVGFDNVASDAAFTTSVNLQEIAGGFGNALAGVIADTTRITGTYTSQAFSLATRALIVGGSVQYGGATPVCETITANAAKLIVSKTPAKHQAQPASDTLGWCYIREHGASSYMGTNYGIDLATKTVSDFTAVVGTQYDVIYFTENASAEVLALPENFQPKMVSVEIKYGVYAKQNNSVSGGTFQGWLYVIVPRAYLSGNAGVDANQTANATTDGSWMATTTDDAPMVCGDCLSAAKAMAYYVYVPCGGSTASVEGLVVMGGGVALSKGEKAQIPVKYLMRGNHLAQPDYTDMTYQSESDAVATVDTAGLITAVGNGETQIGVTLTKTDGTTLKAVCAVSVSD
ncbi:MAG: Ig-like domain-containing protein [Clostridia bacterium]|nr:Ig-like domain-containing protein [Clostridia bacterium]